MNNRREIEVFSAGCAVCDDVVALLKEHACPSCTIEVLDMREPKVTERALELGVRSLPAVLVDGKLLDCCQGGPDLEVLRRAGLGQPLG